MAHPPRGIAERCLDSGRRRLGSIEAAALAGIVCAVAWSVSLRGLLAAPPIDATANDIARYYGNPDAGFNALVLLQVMVIGTLAFLWFLGVLRNRLGERAPQLVVTVFFAGGILTAGLAFAGTAALAAPAVLVEAGGKIPGPGEASITRALADTTCPSSPPASRPSSCWRQPRSGGRPEHCPPGCGTDLPGPRGKFSHVTSSEPTVYLFPA